ncbi:MarR family transcriptional regulator [Lentibacillus populi]|uniref:MarR family transcriptional regulator n=1 Tax=Lentibacillus populi TaxID=1827502 RepID=A0A9W5U1M4_9BACI|nr:MarR family transcriptional regulator [Lentibacillus populi]MBT2216977.1 MarR family transcriptional regulator [Virgibacillus dakarensis]GGB58827.1 MarR family transcriptional regulator [Lentibacillus populi]
MGENLSLKTFVVLMKSAKSVEDRIKQDIKRYGVSTTEFTILEALYHKGNLTVQQICDAVLINSGSITYVIDKLQKKGLLKRSPSKSDRRVVHVQITDQGKQLMNRIFPKHQAVIEEVFKDVSPEEKQTVIDVLKKVGLKAERD